MYSDNLDQTIYRRNKQLLRFFTQHGYDVRLVGDNQKPYIVLNDSVLLSCYVRNFDLHFTKGPESSEVLKTYSLKNEMDVSKMELTEILELGEHQSVYKIKKSGTNLFLVGYNYFDEEDKERSGQRYPVFAQHRPKVYFDLDYVSRLAETLNNENYEVVIV
jgi:hypothetical protein